jgi:hypothetical protein
MSIVLLCVYIATEYQNATEDQFSDSKSTTNILSQPYVQVLK